MAEGTPMIPDRDIYRSAQMLVKHQVEGAPMAICSREVILATNDRVQSRSAIRTFAPRA